MIPTFHLLRKMLLNYQLDHIIKYNLTIFISHNNFNNFTFHTEINIFTNYWISIFICASSYYFLSFFFIVIFVFFLLVVLLLISVSDFFIMKLVVFKNPECAVFPCHLIVATIFPELDGV